MIQRTYLTTVRQLVYSETGRSIDTVIIDGKVVMKDRVVQTINEEDLRLEVSELMRSFIPEYEKVVKEREVAIPYLQQAHQRVWDTDLGLRRFIARTQYGDGDLP